MAATAIGLTVGTGAAAGAATLGPRESGESETYRLTSSETSARGTWMSMVTFRVTRVDERTLEISDLRDPRNSMQVARLPDGEVAPRPGPLGDFIHAYNQTVVALAAAPDRPLQWRVGPPGATIPATVRRDGNALAVRGSGPLLGPPDAPPAPRVSVDVAIRLDAERVTAVHAEEQLQFDGARRDHIEHRWTLEAVTP
jgi:hypothetical protein